MCQVVTAGGAGTKHWHFSREICVSLPLSEALGEVKPDHGLTCYGSTDL